MEEEQQKREKGGDELDYMYDWSKKQDSFLCGCFNYVLKLVLLASLGSFMFGFNLSLLNTAITSVNSSFQMCGRPDLVNLTVNGMSAADCRASEICTQECEIRVVDDEEEGNDGREIVFCRGGYNDVECDSLKWYNAFLSCAVLIGGAVGSLTGGRFMFLGRRLLLLLTMVIFMVGVISSCVSNSFTALIWARLIVGYAVGVVTVATPTYMSEVTPPESRGKFGVFHQLFITVGIFIPMLLGLPLESPTNQSEGWAPNTFTEFWWRFMVGLGILPALLGLYLLGVVYTFETPVYYVELRRLKDARALLERLYEKTDVSNELDTIIQQVKEGEIQKKNGVTLKNALSDPVYRYVIFVGCVLSMGQQFGGINVFMTSSSEIFRKAGLNSTLQTVMSIVMGLINVIMTFPTIYLIERLGRRTLLLIGSALQFVAVAPAAVAYWFAEDPDNPDDVLQILAVIAVLGFVLFFAVGYGPILWVYLFECFPMEIKDSAAGLAAGLNWVAGIVMVFLAIILPNQISYSLFAALQLLVTIFIFFFMKETKGRALGDSPYVRSSKLEDNTAV